MKLAIDHQYVQNALGRIEGYSSRCYLQNDERPHVGPPRHLLEQTMEALAERWVLIFSPRHEVDTNKLLCGDHDGLTALTVQQFVNSGYAFSNVDVTVVLAVEERIRRACEFVALATAHHRFFSENGHQLIDITPRIKRDDITPVVLPAQVSTA